LGVLGFDFRNPYPLDRQKAFLVDECIPPNLRSKIAGIQPWDDWDPDRDRWLFDYREFAPVQEKNRGQGVHHPDQVH
jgi:hypothetical protein